MPTARSRLADIEGPGLGKPLTASEISAAIYELEWHASRFLVAVEANKQQRTDFHENIKDLIADATARQLREIEEREDAGGAHHHAAC